MKKQLAALLTFLISTTAFSQFKSLHVFEQWNKNEGLTDHVYKSATAFDNTGAFYVVGGTLSSSNDYNWSISK